MFNLADKEMFGEYLEKKIKEYFKNDRCFCKKYLEIANMDFESDDEIRKMHNRLIQIKKGNKGIQIKDLPIFCELLNVTCEELLSAGIDFVPMASRVTNYSVAFSKDKNVWDSYMSREDNLFLNPDEYGNTIIDYAIRFKNYDFLKYLIDNDIIWFDSGDENKYCFTFGAGTKIQRRDPHRIDDYMQCYLMEKDELRLEIIALAIQNDDFEMLDKMRARELPELYVRAHYLSAVLPDIQKSYNENLINAIVNASDKVIDYFTDEFKVRDYVKYKDGSKKEHTFLFPFISEILNGILCKNCNCAEMILNKVIAHNENTYDTIKQLIDDSIEMNLSVYDFDNDYVDEFLKPGIVNMIMLGFNFCENGNIVSFNGSNGNGIITNIVYIDTKSKNENICRLIEKANISFDKIINIKKEYIISTEEQYDF